MLTGKNIFITGGAGFIGKHLVERYYSENNITIFSRDEAKHYYIKKQFPRIRCVVGDVADLDLLMRASKDHDIGIFAASLKQIEAVNDNYEIGVRSIINGAINSRRCAEENGFKAACFISSDKSRAATTLYGAMKFVAGELFIINNAGPTRLSTAIYGNVLNSTGSIIPLIREAITKGYELELYSDQMTRFMLTPEEAMDVIEAALQTSGYNIIPRCDSFVIKDLFELFSEEHGLKFKVTAPRISEKIHEIMASKEEIPRMKMHPDGKHYLMHHKEIYDEVSFAGNEYSSKDRVISKEELREKIKPYLSR